MAQKTSKLHLCAQSCRDSKESHLVLSSVLFLILRIYSQGQDHATSHSNFEYDINIRKISSV